VRKIAKINATKINAAKQRAERYEKKRQAKQRRKETHKEAAIAALVGKRGRERRRRANTNAYGVVVVVGGRVFFRWKISGFKGKNRKTKGKYSVLYEKFVKFYVFRIINYKNRIRLKHPHTHQYTQ